MVDDAKDVHNKTLEESLYRVNMDKNMENTL
jgi:hypothetical protein